MVCMGNICRSPMAEAVLQHQLHEAGFGDRVLVDSAGTHSYHLGNPPHRDTQAELKRRGIPLGTQHSRLITSADLDLFDLVLAMDRENLARLQSMALEAGGSSDGVHAQIALLLDFAPQELVLRWSTDEVPDPYYIGGYDRVYELVEAGCRGVVEHVREHLIDPR